MAKDYQHLWEGAVSAIDDAQAIQTLSSILADKEGRVFASRLDRKDTKLCAEILDNGIVGNGLKPIEKRAFFITLRRVAERHGLLPDRIRIKEGIEVLDEILGSGGFADVKSGTYEGRPVAVKIMRISAGDNFVRIRKQFYKGVIQWSMLSHPNVLGLVGAQEDITKRQLVTVSKRMMYGNIMKYISENHANRLELLHGAAQGLKYLHGANLTHGDLKGSNILVSNDNPPRACLADFDFISTVPDPAQKLSTSAQTDGGTPWFKSPERLIPEEFGKKDALPTQQADIYAFGLVIFQVLTGETPFRSVQIPALGHFVLRGMRPTKPENSSTIGLSDPLWAFVQRCWDGRMELRPKVGEVVAHLGEAAAGWSGLMPPSSQVNGVTSSSEETSDSKKLGRVFRPSSGVTKSQVIPGPFALLDGPPANLTGAPGNKSQGVVALPVKEPQPDRSHDPPCATKISPHFNQIHNPPSPRPLWKGLRYYIRKVLRFFGCWR